MPASKPQRREITIRVLCHARERLSQFSGGEDFMGIRGSVDVVRCVHRLLTEGRGRVLYQRYMITKLHPETGRGLNASIGQQANADDLLDAILFELMVQVSIRKSA